MSGSRPALLLALLLTAALVAGCGPRGGEELEPGAAAPEPTLEVPYTAAEIRAEWTPGLTLELHFVSPERQEWQRWTVVDADERGVEIEYLPVDATGAPVAAPSRARDSWEELRDHALFPAAGARRERVERETQLGRLGGWLYTVREAEGDAVSRFFFADGLPGAPVWMETRRGGELLMAVTQTGRHRRPAPSAAGPETAPAPE